MRSVNNVVSKAIAAQRVIDDVMRRDRGRLLAGLIARLNDFQLAEDALQEACVSALKHWARSGIPHAPLAWLMKVGFNKGIDRIRTARHEAKKSNDLGMLFPDHVEWKNVETIPDERLRLIFTCCHPALEEKSRVALTLRTVCGLTTREIAAAFLDTEKAMGQRLFRAKTKIKAKGIGFHVPEPKQWPDRLGTVLSTLYLIFTTGYVSDEAGPRDLCKEAIFLTRLLCKLRPGDPETEGALALMLLTEARRPARIDGTGAMVPIEEQDHTLWRHDYITEAQTMLERAIKRRQAGPFQIKAAIADCHMMQPRPDWRQMALLYRSLWQFEPTPVVALNWAIVMAETGHIELALQKLYDLEKQLMDFQPWHAAHAHILNKLGRSDEACKAYTKAIRGAPNAASRKFLEGKLQKLDA